MVIWRKGLIGSVWKDKLRSQTVSGGNFKHHSDTLTIWMHISYCLHYSSMEPSQFCYSLLHGALRRRAISGGDKLFLMRLGCFWYLLGDPFGLGIGEYRGRLLKGGTGTAIRRYSSYIVIEQCVKQFITPWRLPPLRRLYSSDSFLNVLCKQRRPWSLPLDFTIVSVIYDMFRVELLSTPKISKNNNTILISSGSDQGLHCWHGTFKKKTEIRKWNFL